MKGTSLAFRHVDVFAERPFAGNGLIVVFGGVAEDAAVLLRTAQELRQFETIFVEEVPGSAGRVRARIFTTDEELPFAGHPIIGAAAALHERLAPAREECRWTFRVGDRSIEAASRREAAYYAATMNQGVPTAPTTVGEPERSQLAAALGLSEDDLLPLPLQVVSTGLPYLIVPVAASGLSRTRVVVDDLESQLAAVGAAFVYVLDPSVPEGRTWDNRGDVEDIATGSAAGPVAAYLAANGPAGPSAPLLLQQGRFAGRPSVIRVDRAAGGDLLVGGPVAPVAEGTIRLPDGP
jgi:trans-2,3-dihydro-3-hydroxyanthranilate isomerase